MSVKFVAIGRRDKKFSRLLLEISDCPEKIYCIGNLKLLKEPNAVSVVGSRRATNYGLTQSENLSYDLAKSGLVIVSGLAIGIDGQAHRGALRAKGKTIAVLGTSIDKIYPHTHLGLAREIIKNNGLIISEFGPDDPFFIQNFLLRNRIIAGLSRATVVVEAAQKSGALVTANLALNYNRDVFALPADITRFNSVGTNNLIKQGAFLATQAKDVLDVLGLEEGKLKLVELTKEEKSIFEIINCDKSSFDDLVKKTKIKASQLNSCLLQLEIKGMIKSAGSGEYEKV